MYFSKSKYREVWQCPKILWLKKHKAELFEIGSDAQYRFELGNEIGDLAMELFGDYVDVTEYTNEEIDLSKMLKKTADELKKGTSVICEASFDFDGLYCAVDILKKESGGYAIYEVKSTTHDDKDINIADIAYQKYVLKKCGVNVVKTYIIIINNEYIFDGVLDIHKFFKITDVEDAVNEEYKNVESNLKIAEEILSKNEEPDIDISVKCTSPYTCGFYNYCHRHIPTPSVFDLYNIRTSKKIKLYNEGIITYEALKNSGKITGAIAKRQIDYYLNGKKSYINKEKIAEFLTNLTFPLYFLDFETMQPPLPLYIGTKPYQRIPFQYSIHFIESEGGKLEHREFLAKVGVDPRYELAKKLCADIPTDTCVTAYNKKFECGVIKDLAETFPALREHLLNIRDNIVDLLDPFQSGYYYKKEMGGSFSIKSVLPALFPDDPELNYKNLEGIHNGTEAMNIFPTLSKLSKKEQEEVRRNLLEYCKLDTLAMVKIWEELVRITNF